MQDIETYDLEAFKYNFVNITAFRAVDSEYYKVMQNLKEMEKATLAGTNQSIGIINRSRILQVCHNWPSTHQRDPPGSALSPQRDLIWTLFMLKENPSPIELAVLSLFHYLNVRIILSNWYTTDTNILLLVSSMLMVMAIAMVLVSEIFQVNLFHLWGKMTFGHDVIPGRVLG